MNYLKTTSQESRLEASRYYVLDLTIVADCQPVRGIGFRTLEYNMS